MKSPIPHIATALALVAMTWLAAAAANARPAEEGVSCQPKTICRLDVTHCPLGRCETQQRKPKPKPTAASEVVICNDAGLIIK